MTETGVIDIDAVARRFAAQPRERQLRILANVAEHMIEQRAYITIAELMVEYFAGVIEDTP